MIRIEQFLFEYNVERTQAESLISRFPNLSFTTQQEFVDYFASQNINLTFENKVGSQKEVFQEKDELLQRFKDFKSSTDYDYVKRYIAEQRRIQSAIQDGNVTEASNFLDSVIQQPVDPFFNFIVRKLLTGSESGVLPSERLQDLLNELTKKTKQEIDLEPDVSRDDLGRVISFDNYLRNKGSLRINLLDERFTIETFNYVVNKEFNQLEDAVVAERNVLRRAANFDTLFPLDPTGDGVIDGSDFVENLKKLILADANNVPALEARLSQIQEQLKNINDLVAIREESIGDLNRIIEELSIQRNLIVDENIVKDETIVALNALIDTTIAELEEKVSQQLTNTTDAFDALATQIESQAKKSEESAAKQLAAFEKAVGGIADALKPAEPEPDPENPAAEIIKQILQKWDNITAITNDSYKAFDDIMTDSGITNKPVKSTYVFVSPAQGNAYTPSEEIKQHLKWNNEIKSQIKSTIITVSDEAKAKKILANVDVILKDSKGSLNNEALKRTVEGAIFAWSTDAAAVRGKFAPIIRKLALEMGVDNIDWNNINGYGDDEDRAGNVKNILIPKIPTDTRQLINLLTILDEIKQGGAGFGW